MKRKINVPLIKQWIRENHPNGKEKLALGASISVSMIEKVITYKYYSDMLPHTMDAFCRAMSKPIDEAFPIESNRTKSSGFNRTYL